jgi:hypothetical protein
MQFLRSQRDMVRPLALKVGPGDFTLTAGADLPTLRLLAVGRRTRWRRRLLLDQHPVQFPEITSSRNLPITFAEISSTLRGSSWYRTQTRGPEWRCYRGRSAMTADEHLF